MLVFVWCFRRAILPLGAVFSLALGLPVRDFERETAGGQRIDGFSAATLRVHQAVASSPAALSASSAEALLALPNELPPPPPPSHEGDAAQGAAAWDSLGLSGELPPVWPRRAPPPQRQQQDHQAEWPGPQETTGRPQRPLMRSELGARAATLSERAGGVAGLVVRLLVIGEVTNTTACILIELIPNEVAKGLTEPPLFLIKADRHEKSSSVSANRVKFGSSGSAEARLADGLPVVYCFNGLEANATYNVSFGVGVSAPLLPPSGASFRTFSADTDGLANRSMRVGVTSCNRFSATKTQIPPHEDVWKGLQQAVPELDLVLHLGDNVFQDDGADLWRSDRAGIGITSNQSEVLEFCMWCQALELLRTASEEAEWETHRIAVEELFRETYRRTWSHPPTVAVLSSVPNIFVLDDHEVRAGWGDQEADKVEGGKEHWLAQIALQIAWEYEYSLLDGTEMEPDWGAQYSTVQGEVGVLRVDPRFSKILHPGDANASGQAAGNTSGGDQAAAEQKKYLGLPQWAWLSQVLGAGGEMDKVKALLVLLPIPAVFAGAQTPLDGEARIRALRGMWDDYPEEQHAFLKLLGDWKAGAQDRELTILSGDVQIGGHYRITLDDKTTLDQLVASPVAGWESPELLKLAKQVAGSRVELTNSASFQAPYVLAKNNFGVVSVGMREGAKRPVIDQELWTSDGRGGRLKYSELASTAGAVFPSAWVRLALGIVAVVLCGYVLFVGLHLFVYTRGFRPQLASAPLGFVLASIFLHLLAQLHLRSGEGSAGSAGYCGVPWSVRNGKLDHHATCPYGVLLPFGVTLPIEPSPLDLIALVYGLVPAALFYLVLAKFVLMGVKTRTVELRDAFFFSFAYLFCPSFELTAKVLVESPRPHMSCNMTCGMPSGHAVFAIGLTALLVLDAYHRVWPRRLPVVPGLTHATFGELLAHVPFLGGEVLSRTQFFWLCVLWKLALVPITWSRIQLYDHTPYQVAMGSLLGVALAALWFFVWQLALYPWQWRVGRVVGRIFKHDFPLPVLKLRALAVTAVVDEHAGEEAVQKLLQEGKRKQLVQEVHDWQRGLERCLNATAKAGGTSFKDLLWEIEFEQQDMSQVIQEIKDAYKKELAEGPRPEEDEAAAATGDTPPKAAGEGADKQAGDVPGAASAEAASPAGTGGGGGEVPAVPAPAAVTAAAADGGGRPPDQPAAT